MRYKIILPYESKLLTLEFGPFNTRDEASRYLAQKIAEASTREDRRELAKGKIVLARA
jgi:hypothetical protein